jgi:hypothetical protein
MTGPSAHAERPGVALLLVLATLVLASSAIASAARLTMLSRAERKLGEQQRIANDLLNAADSPIMRWLNVYSHRVILPPEAPTPEAAVLDDRWIVEGTEWSLRITAWDQCGMMPGMGRASEWRDALPRDARALLQKIQNPHAADDDGSALTNLNALASDPTLDRRERESIVPRPSPSTPGPAFFGREATARYDDAGARRPIAATGPSLGALIASHNPPSLGAGEESSIPAINIHTAPMPLLKVAFRRAGRGGLEAVQRARASRRAATIPDLVEHHERADLKFVSASGVWSFRIDAGVGRARRSWWAVYARSGSQWQLVQRWVIPA